MCESACLDEDVPLKYCDGYSTTDYLIIGAVALGLVVLVGCLCIGTYACARKRTRANQPDDGMQGQALSLNSAGHFTYGGYTQNEDASVL